MTSWCYFWDGLGDWHVAMGSRRGYIPLSFQGKLTLVFSSGVCFRAWKEEIFEFSSCSKVKIWTFLAFSSWFELWDHFARVLGSFGYCFIVFEGKTIGHCFFRVLWVFWGKKSGKRGFLKHFGAKSGKGGIFQSILVLVLFCFRGNGTVAVKKTRPCFPLSDTTLGHVQLSGMITTARIRDDNRVVCDWYLIQ